MIFVIALGGISSLLLLVYIAASSVCLCHTSTNEQLHILYGPHTDFITELASYNDVTIR